MLHMSRRQLPALVIIFVACEADPIGPEFSDSRVGDYVSLYYIDDGFSSSYNECDPKDDLCDLEGMSRGGSKDSVGGARTHECAGRDLPGVGADT